MKKQSASGSRAFIYARVSSREQQESGYSIDAQLKLLREYARNENISVIREFTDAETAKDAGRTNFGLMLKALEQFPEKERLILVEKTDRLYRNIRDWVTVDDLEVVVHFVKDGYVLSEASRSNDKFIHGIKVLMAKNYVDNLSEEVRKGLNEKLSQGTWPGKAPLGYRTVTVNGKCKVALDDAKAPLVRQLFDRYALGDCSLTELTQLARSLGLRSTTDRKLTRSALHRSLQNVFYTGRFVWDGVEHQGNHPPLISNELFDAVQEALKRDGKPDFSTKREFSFIGLLKCAHCGCAVTAEMKKGKYIYYHCTGFKGGCDKPYISEEELDRLFKQVVTDLQIDQELVDFSHEALRQGNSQLMETRQIQVTALSDRLTAVRNRLDRVYEDKLDGKIDEGIWERKHAEYQEEINQLERELGDAGKAPQPYYESVKRIIELAQTAPGVYSRAIGPKKRSMLRILLSNCTFDGVSLHPDYRKPFSLFAEMKLNPRKRREWDSNPRYG